MTLKLIPLSLHRRVSRRSGLLRPLAAGTRRQHPPRTPLHPGWIFLGVVVLAGCQAGAGEVSNNKDLNQNMMDLRLYQENMGDYLRKNDLDDASWLLEGMDSILLILSDRFPEHRRLGGPFSYYYKKEMQAPVRGLREALREKDTARAMKNYRLLVDHCNDCHIDNEVDKKVRY